MKAFKCETSEREETFLWEQGQTHTGKVPLYTMENDTSFKLSQLCTHTHTHTHKKKPKKIIS